MERSSWKVNGRDAPSPSQQTTTEKIPYVALQRQNDNMTESQKEGVRVWNLMVKTLRDSGLMEDKK